MTTSKRRITISLTPSLDRLLQTIASAGGASQSGLVVEILESAEPTLQRMAEGFQRIRQATDADRARMREVLDVAIGVVEPMAVELAAGLNRAIERAIEAPAGSRVSAARPESAGAASAGVSPPLGNTGGRSARKTTMAKGKVRAVAVSPVKSAV